MGDAGPGRRRSPEAVAASVAVTFTGIHQGLVPLVSRAVLDRERRFAPALWLPSPWWWLACTAIVAAAVALLLVLHRRSGEGAATPAHADDPAADEREEAAAGYDAASAVVFLIGIYNGVAPLVVRLVFGGDHLLLALPLRLASPWWWIVSVAVIVAALVALEAIDRAKRRHLGDDDPG